MRAGFEGLAYTGAPKPDPTLAVGHDRILLTGDWSVELRDRTGSLLATRSFDAFFEPAPAPNTGGFNPRALYDPQSQRFFIVTTDFVDQPCAAGACVANLLLAVSRTSSPDGLGADEWHFYALDATLDGAAPTTNSADLPFIGMNDSAVVISSSMIGINDNLPKYAKLRILEKEKLLHGEPATWTDLFGMPEPITGGNAWQLVPAHSVGTDRLFFLTAPFTNSCSLTVWAIESPLQNPTISARVAPAAGVCAPPPPPPQPLGALPFDWTFNAIFGGIVHRGTSLWTSQSIASGGAAGIRWVEIDVSDWPNSVSYRQDSTLAQDGVSLFCPTIAVDEDHNTLIAFARSGPSEFASLYYMAREATDRRQRIRAPALLKAGEAALVNIDGSPQHNGQNRYGDYFGMALDPVDGSFWIHGEYARTSEEWGTWVANVTIGPPR